MYSKVGKAISSLSPYAMRDPQAGICLANPWKVLKGATGYYGLQIDTRRGLALKDETELERQLNKTVSAEKMQ